MKENMIYFIQVYSQPTTIKSSANEGGKRIMRTEVTLTVAASKKLYLKAKCAHCQKMNVWTLNIKRPGNAKYNKFPGFANEEGRLDAIERANKAAQQVLDSEIKTILSLAQRRIYSPIKTECVCAFCGEVALWSTFESSTKTKLSKLITTIGGISLPVGIGFLISIIVDIFKYKSLVSVPLYKWIVFVATAAVFTYVLVVEGKKEKMWNRRVSELDDEYLPIIALDLADLDKR